MQASVSVLLCSNTARSSVESYAHKAQATLDHNQRSEASSIRQANLRLVLHAQSNWSDETGFQASMMIRCHESVISQLMKGDNGSARTT